MSWSKGYIHMNQIPLGEKAQSTLHCIPSLTVSFIKSMNALVEKKSDILIKKHWNSQHKEWIRIKNDTIK